MSALIGRGIGLGGITAAIITGGLAIAAATGGTYVPGLICHGIGPGASVSGIVTSGLVQEAVAGTYIPGLLGRGIGPGASSAGIVTGGLVQDAQAATYIPGLIGAGLGPGGSPTGIVTDGLFQPVLPGTYIPGLICSGFGPGGSLAGIVTDGFAPVQTPVVVSPIEYAINLGYAQVANAIGTPFKHYRPVSSGAISNATLINTLKVSFAQNGSYKKPGKVGNDEWYGYYDATTVTPGDYFSNGSQTYFVAAQQPLLPYLTVYCERVINLLTVTQTGGGGVGDYGGNVATNEQSLLTQWPASIVQGSRGEKGDITLPEDVRSPWWTIRLPATPGVVIQNSMIITDDLSRRYIVSSAEQSPYGWRLTVKSAES